MSDTTISWIRSAASRVIATALVAFAATYTATDGDTAKSALSAAVLAAVRAIGAIAAKFVGDPADATFQR